MNEELERLRNQLTALHGIKGQCPTCYETGTFDTRDSPEGKHVINFLDSIWWNKHTDRWECVECWAK